MLFFTPIERNKFNRDWHLKIIIYCAIFVIFLFLFILYSELSGSRQSASKSAAALCIISPPLLTTPPNGEVEDQPCGIWLISPAPPPPQGEMFQLLLLPDRSGCGWVRCDDDDDDSGRKNKSSVLTDAGLPALPSSKPLLRVLFITSVLLADCWWLMLPFFITAGRVRFICRKSVTKKKNMFFFFCLSYAIFDITYPYL